MIEDFLSDIVVLDFTAREVKVAGKIRAAFRMQGAPIGAYDSLIAATAMSHGLTLVTSNISEFARIGGLTVENWRGN